MGQFLEQHQLIQLTQYEKDYVTSLMYIKETKFRITQNKTKKPCPKKSPGTNVFIGRLYQKIKKISYQFYTISPENEKENSFNLYLGIIFISKPDKENINKTIE